MQTDLRSAGGAMFRRPKQLGGMRAMSKRSDRSVIVGLDIGTSKVVALVGEVGPDGAIEILGIGSQPSRGLKKGVVVNIESTVQSIQRAVEEAELMAGCEIHSVFAGDRKSTRLNSSHVEISYAVFCLKKTKHYRTVNLE